MSIYDHTSEDRTPYTYLIGWTKQNKWYYGVQFRKGCHPSNLWVKYFTSSKTVKTFRKIHGEPDVVMVRKIFHNVKDAVDWEIKVLHRMGVPSNTKFLNGHCGGNGYNAANQASKVNKGTITVKNKITGDIQRVPTKDPRIISGEYVICGFTSGHSIQRELPISNETKEALSKRMAGKVSAKDIETGECFIVTKEEFDNNISLVGICAGMHRKLNLTQEQRTSRSRISSDTAKGMVSALNIETGKKVKITKEEFDANPNLYVGQTKGMFPAKDKYGNKFYISNEDPRYLSGELVHAKSKHKIPK